jgi:diadenosine tetraphosphate (Ap4A) HIT family hydrolase
VLLPLSLILALAAQAETRICVCELNNAQSMAEKQCSLCMEAEKQPADGPVFFLQDINPRKPNRWLALPRAHQHVLSEMPAEARLAYWNAAIEKARALWGDDWGLAMNGDERRTQCHTHLHIGKLLEGTETSTPAVVDSPAGIPIPTDGTGFWVHPVAGKLHVHSGEQVTEFVLMR